MCGWLAFLVGPWVWVIGASGIVLGGLALALEEGKLGKIVGGIFLGIGIVVAAPKIMDKLVPSATTSVCPMIVR
ncbi:hypothetical protein [Flavobacterium sp.]|uniref:hypothetical protein n=1 Tax=Flavobacterium sp. TaxID=239 RepID=UPI00261D12F2|nr:hypothetical protein [Flavobacterium sp.]